MKKILLVILLASFAFAANADEKRINFKDLSPQQRKEYVAKEKAAWNKLTKEQKLAAIEKKRAEKLQKMVQRIKAENEKWLKLSADDKIAMQDKRMKTIETKILKLGEKKDKKC